MKPIPREQYRITAVKVPGRGRIRLKYINDYWIEVDLAPLIARGGQLARFADDQFLVNYRTKEHGMYLDWPGDIALSAETLWEMGTRWVNKADELSIEGLGRPIPEIKKQH